LTDWRDIMRKYSDSFSAVLNYFFAVDVPWQFRLLVIMVLIFFGGGLLLNYQASLIPLSGLEGQHTPEYDKMLVNFALEKHKALANSANLLYDFSKIALGALIASITQIYTRKATKNNKGQDKDTDNA
jgi:hypothetical protein